MSSQEPRAVKRLGPRPLRGLVGLLVLACACAGSGALPRVPKPPIVERSDAPAALPGSRLFVPLESDLGGYEAILAEVLREHVVVYQDKWTRVTGPGVVPVVESRMESRIGTPSLRIDGRSVRVAVPFSYWGEVRARAKIGVGPMWLSTGTPWGDEQNPGHITLEISIKPEVDERWRLRTKSKLVGVKLEAPAFEQVCADSILRVCVGRDQATKYVHALLEREVRKAAPSMLAALDKRVQQQADFRSAVEMGFRALSNPPGKGTLWLDIERMAMGPLHGEEQVARLDLELVFRPSWADKPEGKKPELPPRTLPGKDQDSTVGFDLSVSFADLSATLTEALHDLRTESWQLSGVEALGAIGPGPGLALALSVRLEERTHVVYVAATPLATEKGLRLAEPKLSTASRALLSELDVDEKALLAGFAAKAHVPLESRVKSRISDLQNRLSLLTLAFGAVALELDSARYGEIWFDGAALAVRVSTDLRSKALR